MPPEINHQTVAQENNENPRDNIDTKLDELKIKILKNGDNSVRIKIINFLFEKIKEVEKQKVETEAEEAEKEINELLDF